MAFTGKLVFLAITALAWFVYSVLVNNSGEATPLIIELARDAALVLSGVIVVWALEIIVVDLLVGGVWGVPSTALRRFVVYLVLGLTAAGVILKYALNVNLATLLTTSALITVVIGLAAQSTLAALFSGIALALERRIQTGDIIRVDNHLARVEFDRLALYRGAQAGRDTSPSAECDDCRQSIVDFPGRRICRH